VEIGIVKASQQFKISKQALVGAVKRGVLPAMVVEVTELRFKPKDVAAYVATIPEWRKVAGRKGGLARWANASAATGRRA
jgi:hypothetical protein